MARIRWSAAQGTLSADLSDSDTVVTSAALADFPVVTAPDYAVLILDPGGLTGRPEIAYITDHTAAATSATISRGNETDVGGAAARAHLTGVEWAHGPTPADFSAEAGATGQIGVTVETPSVGDTVALSTTTVTQIILPEPAGAITLTAPDVATTPGRFLARLRGDHIKLADYTWTWPGEFVDPFSVLAQRARALIEMVPFDDSGTLVWQTRILPDVDYGTWQVPDPSGYSGQALVSDGATFGWAVLPTPLIPTPVKTAAYAASALDYVRVDTTGGSFAVTLPAAPANGSVVAVKRVAGTNTGTVVTSGSDVFNVAGGGTTATLTLLNTHYTLTYSAVDSVWIVETSLSLAQLDARFGRYYDSVAPTGTITDGATWTNSSTGAFYARVGGAWVEVG